MPEEEAPDPFDSSSRELPTIEELEKELALQVPEAAARIIESDPERLALQALRHLDYKLRRVYELHLGLAPKRLPMNFTQIAADMGISPSNAGKLFRRASLYLGQHGSTLEKRAAAMQEDRIKNELDLGEIAAGLSTTEFEVLEMVAEGRTWAEAGRETGIGGLAGAAELRNQLAERIGVNPENIRKMEQLAPELVRLYLEERETDK